MNNRTFVSVCAATALGAGEKPHRAAALPVITFSEAILRELKPGAIVTPGHGRVGTYDDLVAYIAMLKGVRAKLAELVKSGATLEQAIAAKPTSEWDKRYGDPTRIINRGYASLKRQRRTTRPLAFNLQ